MPRVSMNADGINIAIAGHSVDEGEEFLSMSAKAIALPIYLRGTVAVSGGGVDTGAPSPYNNLYRRMTVALGKTFPAPPIVLLVAKWSYGMTAYLPTRASVSSTIVSGSVRYAFQPVFVEITTSQIHLWDIFADIESMSYLVLENTLS